MPGVKKQSTSYSQASSIIGENNDCHVRAFALVMGISYEDSHKYHEEEGRKFGGPTFYKTSRGLVKRFGLKEVSTFNGGRGENGRLLFKTVKQFVWDHPKGKYLVHRDGHAFAVIDGVVHDWAYGTGPRSRVVFAAKLEEESTT